MLSYWRHRATAAEVRAAYPNEVAR
jgi:hypothetical protein